MSSAVAALSVAAMAFLAPTTPFWLLAVLLVVSGAARSVGFTAYNTIAFADVEQADMTPANTLSSTLQQTAAGFGVAVAAVVIRAASGLGGDGPYTVAFWVIAALLVVACVEGILMSRSAGDTVRPVGRVRA